MTSIVLRGKRHVQKAECSGHRHRRALLGPGTGQAFHRPGSRPRQRDRRAALRSGQPAHQGDGRGRHRHPGAVARRALDPEAAGRHRGRPVARGVNDRLAKVCAANRKRFAAFAALPTADPKAAADELERCCDQARLQGRHAARHDQRRIPRPQEILADLRARRKTRRADLLPSLAAAPEGDGSLFAGLRQGLPAGGASGLGLHGGNRDAGDPAGAVGRVRRASEPESHPRPSSARRCRFWSGASMLRSSGRGRSR